jgi:hypothetical protein
MPDLRGRIARGEAAVETAAALAGSIRAIQLLMFLSGARMSLFISQRPLIERAPESGQ